MGWSVLSLFSRQTENPPAVFTDPTVYSVETVQRVYCGHIIFQDDIQLKLQTADLKAIKILKKNIRRVHIVRNTPEKETPNTWKHH